MLYRVTQVLSQAQLLDFISSNQKVEVDIEAFEPNATPEPQKIVPRAKRVSKVNSAILAAMKDGPASVPALKAALQEAHMSPGSLSTGLSQLQKSGEVKRVGEGFYGLANFKDAAE